MGYPARCRHVKGKMGPAWNGTFPFKTLQLLYCTEARIRARRTCSMHTFACRVLIRQSPRSVQPRKDQGKVAEVLSALAGGCFTA